MREGKVKFYFQGIFSEGVEGKVKFYFQGIFVDILYLRIISNFFFITINVWVSLWGTTTNLRLAYESHD